MKIGIPLLEGGLAVLSASFEMFLPVSQQLHS
jgi:hypothetical protein